MILAGTSPAPPKDGLLLPDELDGIVAVHARAKQSEQDKEVRAQVWPKGEFHLHP
jgi:hypothetical protein